MDETVVRRRPGIWDAETPVMSWWELYGVVEWTRATKRSLAGTGIHLMAASCHLLRSHGVFRRAEKRRIGRRLRLYRVVHCGYLSLKTLHIVRHKGVTCWGNPRPRTDPCTTQLN